MRARLSLARVGLLIGLPLASGAALAGDTSPAIVIPGRPDVPVMMNGRDVSGAIVEGDWGLARPGFVAPTVIYIGPHVLYGSAGGNYFPSAGRPPRYGRDEKIPPANRRLPKPAESYHRAWGASSDHQPASADTPPPVIVVPEVHTGRPARRVP